MTVRLQRRKQRLISQTKEFRNVSIQLLQRYSFLNLLRNLSSLPLSAAELKPDHAGLAYSSLASTVQRKTSSRQSWWRPWARRTRKQYSVLAQVSNSVTGNKYQLIKRLLWNISSYLQLCWQFNTLVGLLKPYSTYSTQYTEWATKNRPLYYSV